MNNIDALSDFSSAFGGALSASEFDPDQIRESIRDAQRIIDVIEMSENPDEVMRAGAYVREALGVIDTLNLIIRKSEER